MSLLVGVEINTRRVVSERKRKKTVCVDCVMVRLLTSGFHYSVLIDDRAKLGRDWEARGGIFIHHTDTKRTLQQLKDLGILSECGVEEVSFLLCYGLMLISVY